MKSKCILFVGAILLLTLGELSASEGKRVYNVLDFGAVGDLSTLDTDAIQKAIDKCHSDGGGTVVLQSGYEFLSGTLILKSNVVLEVQKHAMLRGSRNLKDYIKTVPEIMSYAVINLSDYALIQAINAENIGIKGKGIIDGDGVAIPGRIGYGHLKIRPYILRFIRCNNLQVRDVTLRNPNFWVQHYLECDSLHIAGIKVQSINLDPFQPNGDGIDIDGCQHVLIENVDIRSEDDGIALKSGTMRPMKDVIIRNSVIRSNLNAIKLGTETHGTIRDVTFRDNRVAFGGRAALAVICADGAHIENITFENITIDETAVPIFLRLGDRGRKIQKYKDAVVTYNDRNKRVRQPDDPEVGTMRNITFRNIVSKGVKVAQPPKVMPPSIGSAFSGVNGHMIEGIVLENIDLTYKGGITDKGKIKKEVPERPANYPTPQMFGELPAYAFYFRHVEKVKMKDVYIHYLEKDYRSAIVFDNALDVRMSNVFLQKDKSASASPVVEFSRNSDNANIKVTYINAMDRYRVEGSVPK